MSRLRKLFAAQLVFGLRIIPQHSRNVSQALRDVLYDLRDVPQDVRDVWDGVRDVPQDVRNVWEDFRDVWEAVRNVTQDVRNVLIVRRIGSFQGRIAMAAARGVVLWNVGAVGGGDWGILDFLRGKFLKQVENSPKRLPCLGVADG